MPDVPRAPARGRAAWSQAVLDGLGVTGLPPLPAEARDPHFAALYDYWSSLSRDGRLPGRRDIDPTAIPSLLSALILYDVVPGAAGPRFRVRLAGPTMVNMLGYEPRGRFLDEMVVPDKGSDVNAAFARVAGERIAHYWENRLWTAGRDFMTLQRLALPLADDGRRVDTILAFHVRVLAG